MRRSDEETQHRARNRSKLNWSPENRCERGEKVFGLHLRRTCEVELSDWIRDGEGGIKAGSKLAS